jgi:hypothetical protein
MTEVYKKTIKNKFIFFYYCFDILTLKINLKKNKNNIFNTFANKIQSLLYS